MGNFDKSDSEWCKTICAQGSLTEYEEAILLSAWDQQTDHDISLIESRLKKEKQLRSVCLYKIILFPFDYLISRIIFGATKAKEKKRINALYRSFYRKNIKLEVFEKELNYLLKNGNII